MTRTVKWSASAALLVVLVLIAAWFLLITPKRSAAAELRAQALQVDVESTQLGQKILVLKGQAQELPKKRARLAAIEQHLPLAPALPSLLANIDKAAEASGVVLGSLDATPPVSRAANAPVGPVTLASRAGGTSGPYLQEIQLTMKATGDFAELEDFLSRLEEVRRSVLTTDVTVSATDGAFGPRIRDAKLEKADLLEMTLNVPRRSADLRRCSGSAA
jgi:hypothetical protein